MRSKNNENKTTCDMRSDLLSLRPLHIHNNVGQAALIFDKGENRLNNSINFAETDNRLFNVIIDADNDQVNEQFNIYRDSTEFSGMEPAVRFHLDGGDSWINGGGSFIVGSDNLPPTAPITDTLLFFDKSKGAFRVGGLSMSDDYWAPDSIGFFSIASGRNTTASGLNSTAMGNQTTASGQNSTAMGYLTTASNISTAMGFYTIASGSYSTAMGNQTTALGYASTAMGRYTTASGYYSTAMGNQTTALGDNSTAMGSNTKAKGFASTVIGMYNDSNLTANQTSITPTTPLFIVGNGDDNNTRTNAMVINKNGRLGLGLNLPAHPIHHSNGARLTAAGDWNNASDRRLKSNIQPISYGLRELMQLQPSTYTINTTGEQHIGFIAQDLKKIIPEVVSGTEGDMKKGETLGVSYGNMVALLTKAIQEQQTTISNYELRLQTYESEIETLKAQNVEILSQSKELKGMMKSRITTQRHEGYEKREWTLMLQEGSSLFSTNRPFHQ